MPNFFQHRHVTPENVTKVSIKRARSRELKTYLVDDRTSAKEIFYIKDLVRIIQPSDKTRQVWSNEIYEIEKVYEHLKVYSVYD
jgi:hypothetical protein